ncbi:SDR family NAD(P)-dependent oxidoreductase [Klenkia taihuensis]|uniref:NAD(P)-dependent dehydrogenase, short-chain alcohol dehydrogenase family n=1 Tax=Klenkia taihuensis TaxID=1225127 RepID=A0A1I1SLT7_9ACTN|nr:SDR family NAD(P)-dependent oxidoreductase [Klenkia taihuensis]GHE13350.1 short-chain dehydrogenase [Klenkia taihuensis]SFD47262.1 NAD(P)-dependent dehydrogenase, short-chain alcohol dehydrogenase family [Klenkia taihuensis]
MSDAPRALVLGASRTLGLGLVRELAAHGWQVTGTARGEQRTPLHDLADADGRVTVDRVDITVPDELVALRERLADRSWDLLLVNAGVTGADEPVGDVDAAEFARVLVTNAWAPLQAVELLDGLVAPGGTVAVMSSRQGSIGLNTRGGHEVYRASKSALNQLMRSYAVRAPSDRTLLCLHPGWVQTELGGSGAPLTVEQSVAGLVRTIEAHRGEPGLQFRDHEDAVVPW